MRHYAFVLVLAAIALANTRVFADPILLTFEGLTDNEDIQTFYNGGAGSAGTGPGPNVGVSFFGAKVAIDSDDGGSGPFGGEPSPNTAMFLEFSLAQIAVMNVNPGFDSEISFFYSTTLEPAIVTVYDDLNQGGNVLGVLNLPTTVSDGGDPSGNLSPLVPASLSFSGVARSVGFTASSPIVFDDIRLGSDMTGNVHTPEPTTIAIWSMLTMVGAGVAVRRHRLHQRTPAVH